MKQKLWRSLLYVPGHMSKLVDKAATGQADVVVIDFEDACPADSKESARALLNQHTEIVQNSGKEVAVRINSQSEEIVKDMISALTAEVDIIIVPKVETRDEILSIVNQLEGKEIDLIALIETPLGLLNAASISSSHPLLKAVSLGTEDFSFEMGMESAWDGLYYPSMELLVAAKAAGIDVLGYVGSIAQFRDISAFTSVVEKSSRMGFVGGFAIHPAQIEPLNTSYSPSHDDIELSQRIVTQFNSAMEKGIGAISVDGKMVDLPVAKRAENIIQRAQLIEQRA